MKGWVLVLKSLLTPKEWLMISISTLLSAIILSSTLWVSPVQQGVNPYQLLAFNIDVRDVQGTRIDPFYTLFFANYEAKASVEEKQLVTEVLTEEVKRLHPYSDRHHDFNHPTLINETIFNLKQLNLAHGSGEWLTIDEPFYALLFEAKTMTLFTEGAFNMFIGTVSDFWDDLLSNPAYRLQFRDLDPAYHPVVRAELESLVKFVPMTTSAIEATLELRIVNGQYQVRFNRYQDTPIGAVKITLGAIAKGFANDIMTTRLQDAGLTRGYISNGTSSIATMGPRYGNVPYRWQVTSPHPSANYAMTIEKPGRHSLSTSGAYNGFRMPIGNTRRLRHHIIDPHTGYPSQHAIELNLISRTYPSSRLDAMSTAMMTMTHAEAYAYRQRILDQGYDLEIAWIEVRNDHVHVSYTEGYQSFLKKEANVRYQLFTM